MLILSQHDDDALIGAGYLISACIRLNVKVTVAIFCDGSGGFSDKNLENNIISIRKSETVSAYAYL